MSKATVNTGQLSSTPTVAAAVAPEKGHSGDSSHNTIAPASAKKKVVICSTKEGHDEQWGLDTCAAVDVACSDVMGVRRPSSVPLSVWTAGGVISSKQTIDIGFAPFGETVVAQELPDTPNALALGKRCAESGYGFYWHPYQPVPEL